MILPTNLRLCAACGVVAIAALMVSPAAATAQGTITVAAGASAYLSVTPGSKFAVPFVLDLSAWNGGSLSSLTTSVLWNAAVLTLDSLKGTGFGTITPNLSGAPVGNASFSIASATPTTASVTAANLYFTASATGGGSRVRLVSTAARNDVGSVALGQVLPRGVDVCIEAPGRWGDVNDDGQVDIIDAMLVAQSVVGIAVAAPDLVAARGDVSADGAVGVVDAQMIAAYAADYGNSARAGGYLATPPTIASVVLSRTAASVQVGQALQILPTSKDPSGASIDGCAQVNWTSSDPTKVTVNQTGVVRAIQLGSADITATSGSANAHVTITATVPDVAAVMLHLRNVTAGGSSSFTDSNWMLSDLLTDEWKSSDTFSQRNGIDQRSVPDFDTIVQSSLRELYLARSTARIALAGLTAPIDRAQAYFVQGYAELLLAETFCNGIALDDASSGITIAGPAVSNATVYARAIAHFDTALALAPNSSALDTLATVAKARALLGTGQFTTAAALVSGIPTPFQDLSTLASGETNKIWLLNSSQKRWTVGDNVDPAGAIGNAVNFASAADPRLPVTGTSTGTSPAGKGFDLTTNLVVAPIVFAQFTATPLLSGLDARLIEAEAALTAGNFPGLTAILNSLRAAPPNLGAFTPAAMAALTQPGNMTAAVDLFFREKAFWTFGRGQRLGDLRRMIRYFSKTDATAFPTGTFFKGGTYGTTNNFPVSLDEEGVVLTTACTDRNP